MSALVQSLRKSLAETWSFSFKSHVFHWNVQGPTFSQFHEFFGKIYDDTDGAVDDLAEHLRAIDELAPASLDEIVGPSTITFPGASDANEMVKQLQEDNKIVIDAIEDTQRLATEAELDGLSNFLQERLDRHAKWGWMLKSSLETEDRMQKRGMRSIYRK